MVREIDSVILLFSFNFYDFGLAFELVDHSKYSNVQLFLFAQNVVHIFVCFI